MKITKSLMIHKSVFSFFILFTLWGINSCSSSSSTTTTTTTGDTGLAIAVAADYAAANSSIIKFATAAECDGETPPTTMDTPSYTTGADCDEDSGIVTFVTPSEYRLAVKRVALQRTDDTLFDIIEDTSTLADAQVIEFSTTDPSQNLVSFDPEDLEEGVYNAIYVELYYFEMRFEVAEVERNVRIYMSDDDFASEGDLGHHQGDIVFVENDGTEIGWVDSTWLIDNVTTTRGEAQNGAGGTDPETGHDRGFFGNTDLWNATDQNQGADQDIFVASWELPEEITFTSLSDLTTLTTITMTFSVVDSFFYEDFAPQGTGFFPDTGGEAASENSEWAPLTPTVEITVDTE